jgi:RNA polymerase sigma factor for flagellar operon FliA
MLDRAAAEARFLEHLEWINRFASRVCRSHGLVGADAEDCTALVRMKLIEDDYAVVRRFGGDSELRTYLGIVITRQAASYVRGERGRWRPSAAAQRVGPVAVELERLVRRGGYTLQQAGEKLRTEGLTEHSDVELARLLGQFPERAPLRPEVQEPAAGVDAPGDSRADERVTGAEADSRRADMLRALGTALEQLEPEDQVIVRMHFIEGYTLASVSRIRGLDQKPLYRHVDRLRARLRGILENAGVHRDDVRALFDEPDAQ